MEIPIDLRQLFGRTTREEEKLMEKSKPNSLLFPNSWNIDIGRGRGIVGEGGAARAKILPDNAFHVKYQKKQRRRASGRGKKNNPDVLHVKVNHNQTWP